jgi:hypothetical protein
VLHKFKVGENKKGFKNKNDLWIGEINIYL